MSLGDDLKGLSSRKHQKEKERQRVEEFRRQLSSLVERYQLIERTKLAIAEEAKKAAEKGRRNTRVIFLITESASSEEKLTVEQYDYSGANAVFNPLFKLTFRNDYDRVMTFRELFADIIRAFCKENKIKLERICISCGDYGSSNSLYCEVAVSW